VKSAASVLALLLIAAGGLLAAALLEERRAEADAVRAADVVAATPQIARAVEQIRELEFERLPRPELLTVGQLARRFEREAERTGEADELETDIQVLKMLGLVEADADLSGLLGEIAGDVAGAYDPRTGDLFVISDAIPPERAVVDVTLAHELGHALEDQAFGLRDPETLAGDAALAEEALVEGSATAVMYQFAAEQNLLFDLITAESLDDAGLAEIPPSIQAQILFSYLSGLEFVQELRRAGGDWNIIDIALRSRPPVSTEQVMHPQKYLRGEQPLPVSIAARPVLGKGWRRLDGDTVGEFDLLQLLTLASADAAARKAAAGWGGGRFEMWRRGPASSDCEAPCRERHAIVVATRWDSPAEAKGFAIHLSAYFDDALEGSRRGGGWALPGGSAAALRSGDAVVFALAPNPRTARRLVLANLPGR
jgi:hypothetical protein